MLYSLQGLQGTGAYHDAHEIPAEYRQVTGDCQDHTNGYDTNALQRQNSDPNALSHARAKRHQASF